MNWRVPGISIGCWFTRVGVLAIAITISGCPFYFPTPGGKGAFEPAEEVMQAIRPQVTTRTDVLMMLGDPDYRLEDDRCFVYDWKDTNAVGGFIIPYWDPFDYPVFISEDLHALAIEFEPGGRVSRLKEFTKFAKQGAERDLLGDIREWMHN